MHNMYINPMNGQRIIADAPPGDCWCCLGEAPTEQLVTPPPNADVNMSVGDGWTPDDDEF